MAGEKPAARLGDATAHGGTITAGSPNVRIGGLPAARLGDLHVCPLCDGPKPHVGGPVTMGSPTVLITGQPAARMGDTCTCASPAPDLIAGGCPTVLIGAGGPSLVQIGASGSLVEIGGGGALVVLGGNGGGAGSTGSAAQAAQASYQAGTQGTAEPALPETFWLAAEVVDAAGLPLGRTPYELDGPGLGQDAGTLLLNGRLWRTSLPEEGRGEMKLRAVYGVRWGQGEARAGERVRITAEAAGFDDGTKAVVQIWRQALDGPAAVVATRKTTVRSARVEASWTCEPPPEPYPDGCRGYEETAAHYVADVIVEGQRARSGGLMSRSD